MVSCQSVSTEVDITMPKPTEEQHHIAIECLQAGTLGVLQQHRSTHDRPRWGQPRMTPGKDQYIRLMHLQDVHSG